MAQKLITTKEAAVLLSIKPGTLVAWRCKHISPIPYYKIGHRVFYKEMDIVTYIENMRHVQ